MMEVRRYDYNIGHHRYTSKIFQNTEERETVTGWLRFLMNMNLYHFGSQHFRNQAPYAAKRCFASSNRWRTSSSVREATRIAAPGIPTDHPPYIVSDKLSIYIGPQFRQVNFENLK